MKPDAPLPLEPLAAVDLGSNSFHLVIGRLLGDQLTVLDRLREPVRLAAGLRQDGTLDEAACARALATLERFGQRIADLPRRRVRAVGTYTLRRARGRTSFVSQASRALGVSVEILPGPEEARLIYLGVAHEHAEAGGRRLVIDIGGGSTECILGERFTPIFTESLQMGCVTFSLRFFPEGRFTKKGFQAAEIAAHLEFESLAERFLAAGFLESIGASGTVTSIADVLRQNGLCDGAITLEALKKLKKLCLDAERVADLDLAGLAEDRKPVLAGGLAVLKSAFEALQIERMEPSKAALREGLLYDLIGRIRHEDVRDRTISSMAERHHVDRVQADRVEATALECFSQSAQALEIEGEENQRRLAWAARLSEIGLAVAYSGHHKHGAYLIANSDMPGFSREDQEWLAALVRVHRRKLSRDLLVALPAAEREIALRLVLLLRLSVRLHHARSARPLPAFRLAASNGRLELTFPDGWLDSNALVAADLAEEAELLAAAGWELRAR